MQNAGWSLYFANYVEYTQVFGDWTEQAGHQNWHPIHPILTTLLCDCEPLWDANIVGLQTLVCRLFEPASENISLLSRRE